MALENATWGAPRIHGELRMLGFCRERIRMRPVVGSIARSDNGETQPHLSIVTDPEAVTKLILEVA